MEAKKGVYVLVGVAVVLVLLSIAVSLFLYPSNNAILSSPRIAVDCRPECTAQGANCVVESSACAADIDDDGTVIGCKGGCSCRSGGLYNSSCRFCTCRLKVDKVPPSSQPVPPVPAPAC